MSHFAKVISQSSVAMLLRCDWIVNDHLVAYLGLLLSAPVKEF